MKQKEFQLLVYKHRENLLRYAQKMTSDRSLSEDFVQDIYLKLWQARKSLDKIKNPKAWCLKLLRNRILDHFRSQPYKKTVQLEQFNPSAHLDERQEIDYSLQIKRIEELLKKLPPKQQSCFTLREKEGMTYEEISQIMEISIDQVKINIYRARKKLRTSLESSKFT